VIVGDNSGLSHYDITFTCLFVCYMCRLRSVIIVVSFALSLQSGPVTGSGDEVVTITSKLGI
jgi:hypothetical protein